jgi:phage-related protein
MSTPAGGGSIGDATITVNANTDPALLALNGFSRDAQGRIRDVRGRFVADGTVITRSLTTAAGGGDRFSVSLRGLASIAGSAGAVLGRVGLGLGAVGAAAGTAAPLLAGIVATLQNVAPAGAVAVTGMLAVQQASVAIKLGMVGVQDAVTAAFDTSEDGANKFDAALKKLAPNARSFALQVRELQPAFQKLQQGVQNRLFAGFAGELKGLSSTVLPVVGKNLNETAGTLNKMALGASSAARTLATDGTLGQAMAGANKGLSNLRTIPGQVVTSLGQLAAAGAPAFDRLTAGAAGVATTISGKLSKAFKSGALQKAVDTAVGLLKDLGTVAANVFSTLGNIMAPVQAAGGGLVGTLVQITGALKTATGTEQFQAAIRSLANVMGTLARTVGPLLGQALASIAPIFIALGPPVQRLIQNLGAGLSPIIVGLGPVLAAAADALGILIDALSPLLPIVGNLIASLLPPLVPLLTAVGDAFAQAGPIVTILGRTLQSTLQPVLAQLPALITPLVGHFAMLAKTTLPLLAKTAVQLAPSFLQIGQAFGQVVVAAAPMLAALSQLTARLLPTLLPLLTPIINTVVALASALSRQLASTMTNLVVPALQLVTNLLRGDFSAAWNSLKTLVSGVARHFTGTLSNIASVVGSILRGIVDRFKWLYNVLIGNSIIPDLVRGILSWFGRLASMILGPLERFRSLVVARFTAVVNWARGFPGRMVSALAALGGRLASLASSALSRFRGAVVSGGNAALSWIRGLPGRAQSALGNLGGYLVSSGRSLISGFVRGIRDKIGDVTSAVGSVVSKARDLLPFSPAKEGPFSGRGWTLYSGRAISESIAEGLAQRAALVQRAAAAVARSARDAVTAPIAGSPTVAGIAGGSLLGVGTGRTSAATGTTTVSVTLNLANHGVLGSQFEVENWLINALDNANRTGRLSGLRTTGR